MCSEFVARWGLRFPHTIQLPVYELTSGIVSATTTLLASSVSNCGFVFITRNVQVVKEEAVANSKASVSICMVLCFLDLGKLRAYS